METNDFDPVAEANRRARDELKESLASDKGYSFFDKPEESAGLHILMDARVDDEVVFSREALAEVFSKLLEVLGMVPLGPPVFYEVPLDPGVLERMKQTGDFEDEGGITGFQVISTSHLSLHAWPLQKFFSMDVFSCKSFDANLALSVICESFRVTERNVSVVDRKKPMQPSLFLR